ncbi:MAG: hypothetical protein JSV44_12230 [Candidatus Zixiibacteriota bacterium]|nr:MAG: hypothetical protein JSV44_12230 [candidate division Zixibacteria bacterium]
MATAAEGHFDAGKHIVLRDASNAAPGVYFYGIKAGDNIASKKMLLLK